MRGWIAILTLTMLARPAAADDAAKTSAAQVVTEMTKAMGGERAWERARYWRFDWVVERNGQEVARARHLWDRKDGRYRVEWRTKEGKNVQALFDVNSRRGRAWADGAPAGADSAALLERAYGRFINDFYWLAMPWKLRDPGVHVEDAGAVQLEGGSYELLHVTFDAVGLTPKDQYWAYVNRRTHLMDRWAYFLQGTEGTPSLEHATAWKWSDWRREGGMMLACDRVQVGGDEAARIHFPVLAVSNDMDARLFDSIELPMPGAGTK